MPTANPDKLRPITTTILERKEQLARDVAIPSEIGKGKVTEDLVSWRIRLVEAYAESISQEPHEVTQDLEKWSDIVSGKLVELMLPLNLALAEISDYRGVIGDIIKEEANAQEIPLDDFYNILTKFNDTVDHATQILSQSYMDDFKDTIAKAYYAVNELSVPMVRITETIGVIPIVGEIDTHRAQLLMENALKQGEDYDLDTIILDLSGVSMIDTMVAHQLFKVIHSLELIGVHGILSGIRPDIVQTMVSLGINMKDLDTFSSLHRAIESIN